jgi:HlyD family secretion protein
MVAGAFASVGVGVQTYLKHGATSPSVTTVAVTRGEVVQAITPSGTVEAVTSVEVGTQVSGRVKELTADFNDIVRTGQILARLDPSLFETEVEQARANVLRSEAEVQCLRVALEDALAKLGRSKELAARQLIARSDLDTSDTTARSAEAQLRSGDAQLAQARASLNQVEVNLAHTVITSPIDGIVVSRNVDVGQTVAASMQAPTLYVLAADLTRMRVNASLDEADVGAVRPGQAATFRVGAYPDEVFSGRVAQVRLQPVVTQNVVTYVTVIDVANPQLKLKPGMTATVSIEVARRSDVLRVPNAALRFRPSSEVAKALGVVSSATPPAASAGAQAAVSGGKDATVWRYVDGRLKPVALKTGISDGSVTEMVSGALAVADELTTAVQLGATASAKTTMPATGNPLMGSQPPPPPGGGGPPR